MSTLIDISRPLSPSTPVWPGDAALARVDAERVKEPDPELVATLERQRALESQMQALRAARAAATRSAREGRQPVAALVPAPGSWRGLGELRRDLSDPFALRRAILLKEILGEPVGLRPGMPALPRR